MTTWTRTGRGHGLGALYGDQQGGGGASEGRRVEGVRECKGRGEQMQTVDCPPIQMTCAFHGVPTRKKKGTLPPFSSKVAKPGPPVHDSMLYGPLQGLLFD